MLSSHLAWENIHHQKILFAPRADMHLHDWDQYLSREFSLHPKKLLINILSALLPRKFAEIYIATYCPHIVDTFSGSISKADRHRIAHILGEGIPLTLLERRPGDEFVTA